MKPCYKSPKVEIEEISCADLLLNSGDVLIPGDSLFGPTTGSEE